MIDAFLQRQKYVIFFAPSYRQVIVPGRTQGDFSLFCPLRHWIYGKGITFVQKNGNRFFSETANPLIV
jgi:hypothetical protein